MRLEGGTATSSTRLAAHDRGEWSRTGDFLEDGSLSRHRTEYMGHQKFGPIHRTIESNTTDMNIMFLTLCSITTSAYRIHASERLRHR